MRFIIPNEVYQSYTQIRLPLRVLEHVLQICSWCVYAKLQKAKEMHDGSNAEIHSMHWYEWLWHKWMKCERFHVCIPFCRISKCENAVNKWAECIFHKQLGATKNRETNAKNALQFYAIQLQISASVSQSRQWQFSMHFRFSRSSTNIWLSFSVKSKCW